MTEQEAKVLYLKHKAYSILGVLGLPAPYNALTFKEWLATEDAAVSLLNKVIERI